MIPKYFDIHSHLNDSRYIDDKDVVIARMKAEEVFTMVVGTDLEMSQSAIELALADDHIFAVVGLHPTDNHKENFRIEEYQVLAKHPRVVAIGECGLDFFRMREDTVQERERQVEIFEKQIMLAVEAELPMMIHCRSAHDEVLDILKARKREYGDRLTGNIHFFSEGIETARKYFDLDFTISFTGVITFADQYDEVIRESPVSRLLTETDCPYVSPVPYRGQRNEPIRVVEVVRQMAQIRGMTEEELAPIVVENAFRVFRIPASESI